MQNKYSLANAMAKDGHGMFGSARGADDADSVNPGALVPETPEGTAPLSGWELALTDTDLKLGELAQSLGVLRERVDSLGTSLSLLKAADTQPLKMQAHSETTKVAEFKTTHSEDRRITREVMTVGTGQPLDPVAALRHSNANLSFDTTATSQKSITELREAFTDSEKRLSKTFEPTPMFLEATWLKTKTGAMDATNDFASDSPLAAEAIKTAEAVIAPMVSGFVSGLGETIKSRVAANAVDVTLGKIPVIGKLFREGGFDKDKGSGKGCCCPAAVEIPRGRDRYGPRGGGGKKTSTAPKSASSQSTSKKPAKKTGRFAGVARSLFDWAIKPSSGSSMGFRQGIQPPAASLNGRSPSTPNNAPSLIQALDRGFVPKPSSSPSSLTMPTTGLLGTMSKLESSAARRLGPLKYVDTAIDVAQGIRNGDAKAVGAGLTTAGGAWAGASAGAAIGTLIFPGVGTAVGGAIGGLLGSEAGSWLGDKVFGQSDRLPAPTAVSKELNSARTDNVQVTLAPSIQITGVNPADAQQVVNQVIQALQFQCMPMVTDSLGIRRNAALADPPGGV